LTEADKLLKEAGGQGTDVRSQQSSTESGRKTALVLQGMDPTLDCKVRVDLRALEYLALGTVLRAIRRGWLTGIKDNAINPYYAFVYLVKAYSSATNGTIPALQQAPRYFWELCYALKPKTEKLKTGDINYTTDIFDTLSEVVPSVIFTMGAGTENYKIYWGTTPVTGPDVNGFPVLQPPPSAYDDVLGATSVKSLWESFDSKGLCVLCADPGEDGCLMSHDTSAQSAVYAELGASYAAPGALASTAYSERFITSPLLAKFAIYQEDDANYRGWLEYKKVAGSATYLGPRFSEFTNAKQIRNKVSPTFLMYNFDEFVEQFTLVMCRASEELAEFGGAVSIPAYPLSCQQFMIALRQNLLPYFDNDMAQDLRFSSLDSDYANIAVLPLVVGPNGNAVTNQGAGMKCPRFLAEMIRCCRRITASVGRNNDGVADLVPILGRPADVPQLNQYQWYNVRDNSFNPFFATTGDQAVDLIDCTTGATPDFLDLNGPALTRYITAHNTWITKFSQVLSSLVDISNVEPGIPSLNNNVLSQHLAYVFTEGVSAPADNPIMDVSRPTGPIRSSVVKRPKAYEPPSRRGSQKRPIHVGSTPPKITVGASPLAGSDYFAKNVGVKTISSLMPVYATLWKYQSLAIKPTFWTVADIAQGSSLQYQTVQIQPYTVPIAAIDPVFLVTDGNNSLPSLFDTHLNAANLDVKAATTNEPNEMEIDFDALQRKGHGGFFTSLGKAIGGFVDTFAGG